MWALSLLPTRNISPAFNDISTIPHWLLAESAGPFWWPAELENVTNPDFNNLKHLKNQVHLFLTKPSILYKNPG